MNQGQLGYTIGALADHPNRAELAGNIIGALADHPNEPELAGVYNRNPG